jgi:hypothetical protein
MKDLVFNHNPYKILVDNTREEDDVFLKQDLDFLLSGNLVSYINRTQIKIKFVGEVITPNTTYISLPKNFEQTQANALLTKKVLNKYKKLKKDNKLLIDNYSFIPDTKSEIKSDVFYFNKLKEFFLDYVTYEFVYPKDKEAIHSGIPLKGAIDPVKTDFNLGRYGYGITYKVKDVKNTKEWNLDDIYYSTIKKLAELYASDKDKKQLKEVFNFLIEEGYIINEDVRVLNENPPIDEIVKDIRKSEVGDIHFPIKNTLLRYYENVGLTNKYSVFAYKTKFFNLVWERICQNVLHDDKKFRKEVKEVMDMPILFGKEKTDLDPDIFSKYNGKKFLGDSKYYQKWDSNFDKELYQYNQGTKYKYPVVVFIPATSTHFYDPNNTGLATYSADYMCELIVMGLSLKEVIEDVINNTNISIEKVQDVIKNKTDRNF